jgi:hypothetical protein
MVELADDILHHAALDARMVRVARSIKLLGMVSLADRSAVQLPGPLGARQFVGCRRSNTRHTTSARRGASLAAIVDEADPDHPLGPLRRESALSWSVASRTARSDRHPKVTEFSIRLFGTSRCAAARQRSDHVRGGAALHRHRQRARSRTAGAIGAGVDFRLPHCNCQLQSDLDDFFNGRVIDVVLDPAPDRQGRRRATRIRLRSGAAFSDYDRHQLLEHEAFVHSLTALNGRAQPVLPSLALSSPRTPRPRKGWRPSPNRSPASIDIERMKRVSLRIEAVALALDGANFIECSTISSTPASSRRELRVGAARVPRRAADRRLCLHQGHGLPARPDRRAHVLPSCAAAAQAASVPQLFAGKMTLADVQRFEPLFESGALLPPRWMPQWVARANGLAGMLAFSLFANRIRLDQVDSEQALLKL